MSTVLRWTADGELFSISPSGRFGALKARIDSNSIAYKTDTFWCRVMSDFGNPIREFDTQLHDYNDAKKLAETILRLEGVI